MKKSRFSESQIIKILNEYESGRSVETFDFNTVFFIINNFRFV